ncbi:SWIM zinc finger family protein [bacterium]|nr:SWIM zinc finger family protein [bacterium]
MKLDDFEYYFDEKILERGKIIFESGKVKCLKSFMNYWDFIVPGTKNYDVTIGLKKDYTINTEYCSCPSAKYNYCKHLAACLYFLRKELNIQKETMLSKFLKKNSELVEQADLKTITKKFLQSVFKRIRKQSFIEYNYMPEFEIAIDEILQYLRNSSLNLEKKEFLEVCLFLINTISKTKFNCDDSNGEITRSFYAVVEIIKENILKSDAILFSTIYSDITNLKNEYEFEIDELLELACQFAQTDIDKHKIKKHIDFLIEQSDYPKHFIEIKERYFKS